MTRAGAQTYLSEIYVPRLPPLRPGTICVRGPLRFEKEVDSNRIRAMQWSPVHTQPFPQYAPLVASPTATLQPVQPALQPQVVQIAPQVSHDIDDLVKLDPQFTQTLQVERRQKLGMDTPQIKEFLSKTSLMSLGSYCAVANSFEALGLREAAGPFDWMRSDCQGITHLLRNGFEDFLDWDGTSHKVGGLDVFPMRWGGSFWHHDITDVKVRQTFMRRKERFLNAQNENLLFIRVVNGTQELMQITGLYSALQERFGDKSRVRLLVLIDLQDTEQEVITQDLGRDVIFSCVHHSSWESHIPAPTPEEQARLRLHKASDSYSAALVRALYIWASVGSFVTWPSLASFSQRVVQWVGPDPKRDSFQPSRLSLAPVAATATMLTLNAAMAQPFTQMTQPLTQPLTQPYYFVRPTVPWPASPQRIF